MRIMLWKMQDGITGFGTNGWMSRIIFSPRDAKNVRVALSARLHFAEIRLANKILLAALCGIGRLRLTGN